MAEAHRVKILRSYGEIEEFDVVVDWLEIRPGDKLLSTGWMLVSWGDARKVYAAKPNTWFVTADVLPLKICA